MASAILYPPIIDSYVPSFIAGESSYCRLYFSLSKFNSITDISSIQATVVKQDSGLSVVNDKTNSDNHYRATGIILNLVPKQFKNNIYYIDILNSDLKSESENYNGWIPGWIYKIQIRASAINYDPAIENNQNVWIKNNAYYFSEWSTVSIVKPIGKVNITIPNFGYSSLNVDNVNNTVYLSSLDFIGTYSCEDGTELLNNYRVKLFDKNNNLLEDSQNKKADNKENSLQYFSYIVKTQCDYNELYKIEFSYETINYYSQTIVLNFKLQEQTLKEVDVEILNCENDIDSIISSLTSISKDADAGRVLLKLYSDSDIQYTGKLCVRRTDEKSEYKQWEDIKILNLKSSLINDLEPFYDYTIESGINYKYGVLPLFSNNERGKLKYNSNSVKREFDSTFLLGENNKQLNLIFNTDITSFKINVNESAMDTLGGKYANITRNSKTYYKTFPLSSLITFNMDEIKTFYEDMPSNIDVYDMTFERIFRDKVLEFLYDGKPKLLKSPTEGNIIIRLKDIACSPNKTVSRLIYSFSANAIEKDEPILDNYLKYGFLKLEEKLDDEEQDAEISLGQIYTTLYPNDDIIDIIYKNYDSNGEEVAPGYNKKVTKITKLSIEFLDEPQNINSNSAGYIFDLNGNSLIIYDEEYNFTDYVSFIPKIDKMIFKGTESTSVILNFKYEYIEETYVDIEEEQIMSKIYIRNFGQINGVYKNEFNILEELRNKYYYKSNNKEFSFSDFDSITIEAPIDSVFDINNEYIFMNETEFFEIPAEVSVNSLKYLGIFDEGVISTAVAAPLIINYKYTTFKKTFREGDVT